ncbi:MAG TPA: hypothetical protein VLF20_01090 [Patescibacteria group bacterium]|nr:hypothetical protein [Patescibacteria group bacterium]
MGNPIDLSGIRLITISGRIGAGSTSLAKHLAEKLGWRHIEGGEIFWEAVRKRMHLAPKDTKLRPDEEDMLFEEKQRELLRNEKYLILESKLAGFCAQGMDEVFKIVVVCEDATGADQTQIRIDRLVNREHTTMEEAKAEVLEREVNDLSKWRRLYANNDEQWVYWDRKYYDFTVNTFSRNQEDNVNLVLEKIGFKE